MYYFDPSERGYKEIVTGIRARTYWGEKITVAVVDLDPEAVLPAHSHPHEQGGFVISGGLTMTAGGETRALKPGDVYLFPGGVVHSAVVGPEPTQLLDIFSPVREDFKY